MERTCQSCLKISKSPYKNLCRNCYQNQWVKSLSQKICLNCNNIFKNSGTICHTCLSNNRNERSRQTQCTHCLRLGLIIDNKKENLCIKCNRQKKESEEPSRETKRKDYNRNYSRKKRGTDLNAPIRRSKGKWKTTGGYMMVYKPNHPNAKKTGCLNEHVFVMSEHIKRPLRMGENVHHKNGIRDDNRIENLELWHRGQCPGQRLEEKLEWSKKFLENYGYKVEIVNN